MELEVGKSLKVMVGNDEVKAVGQEYLSTHPASGREGPVVV